MHGLLAKLLQKKGIDKLEDLSREEKEVFDNYEKILSKKELTVEDIEKFLITQVKIIEGKWRDLNLDHDKKAELIPYHTVYSVLLESIHAPDTERSNLESYLIQLTKN